jgi:hypothetical protein
LGNIGRGKRYHNRPPYSETNFKKPLGIKKFGYTNIAKAKKRVVLDEWIFHTEGRNKIFFATDRKPEL